MAHAVEDALMAPAGDVAVVRGQQTGPIVNGLAQGGVTFDATVRAAISGHVAASNLTVASNHDFRTAVDRMLQVIDLLDPATTQLSASVVRTVPDILSCHERGHAGIILGFQNADPLEGNLQNLRILRELGLRIMQLTYQRKNLLGYGCGEADDLGLTEFGRDAVAMCNQIGVLVDVSHTGSRSSIEAAEMSSRPVVISHANLFSRNPVPRNKKPDVIKAIAATGGLMGITSISRLISTEGRQRQASIAEYVDQVEEVAGLVGSAHVAIGLDSYEGMTEEAFLERQRTFLTQFPELKMGGDFPLSTYFTAGLESASGISAIGAELHARGWSQSDVSAVMGGNWLRVLEAAWN